ncbi:MAG: hypothetical protein OXH31_03455 [Gammaproteobacteria bacterium]|nr:hypothetical protein [Gammaproteobacteria bacterium]
MSVLPAKKDSSGVQQKFVLGTLGLVVGFAFSMFCYFLVTGEGSVRLGAVSNDSLNNNRGVLDNTDTLLELLVFEKTSSTNFSTADLGRISTDLKTFDEEELSNAFSSSASLPFSPSLYPIQEMLCEYLVEQSPVRALASLVWFENHRVEDLLPIMVRHMVSLDLEESFELVRGLKQPYRKKAIEAMLKELELTDEALSLLRSLNNAEIEAAIAEQMQTQKIYASVNEDPRSAFDLLLTDDVEDSEQADLFSQVLNELFQIEGLDVIKRLNFLSHNSEFYDELFMQIAAQDRIGTLNYLDTLSPSNRSRFLYPLMENWVEEDLENALDSVSSITNQTLRSQTFATLVREWGRTRPLEALERLKEIPRQHRSAVVLDIVHTLGATNPDEVLRLLPSLKAISGAFTHEIERSFVYSWSSKFPAEALMWVRKNIAQDSYQRDRLLSRVLSEYALVQPQKAMEVAISEDPNPARAELGLSHWVIDSLVENDQLETAIGLLEHVPNNNRFSTYADVAEKLVLEDRFDVVISMSDMVPEADRAAYFRSIVIGLSGTNSSKVLELIAKIPDAQIRSEVVNRTLDGTWRVERNYSEKQLKTLRSFLVD